MNMKTKKCRPVLVECSRKSRKGDLVISPIGLGIHISDIEYSVHNKQQLILISLEDEKLEIGNTIYSKPLNKIDVLEEMPKGDLKFWFNGIYKVIVTQEQISPEYIAKFVEQYNNGGVEDLKVEMEIRSNAALSYKEYVYLEHIGDKKYIPIKIDANINQDSYSLGKIEEFEDWEIEIYPKLTNGFVTIVNKEPILYTEEEVYKLLKLGIGQAVSYPEQFVTGICFDNTLFNHWFTQNKKK